MTDGECWIDCCIPTSLVDAFDSCVCSLTLSSPFFGDSG